MSRSRTSAQTGARGSAGVVAVAANRAGNFDRHELRLRPQIPEQVSRCGDSDQSEHDGQADEQMRIHEFLFVRVR